MKVSKIYLLFPLLILLSSCSSEEDIPTPSNASLLVAESPWNFKSYELNDPVDLGDAMISEQQLIDAVTSELTGMTITFYADGTGFSNTLEEDNSEFTWIIINETELRLDFTVDEFEDIEVYQNIDISPNELRLSTESTQFVDQLNSNFSYTGTLVFD